MVPFRIVRFFGAAVLFALVSGAVSAERSFARTTVSITAADLADDPATAAERRTAQEKVNAKIAASGVTVVEFPRGEFKDVGEIQVFGRSGAAAEPVTLRGNGAVFTGKIMINVQNSRYVTIEGFTFRDTRVPDVVTFSYQAARMSSAPLAAKSGETRADLELEDREPTGTVWLNTGHMSVSGCPAGGAIGNITVRGNVFRNTAQHGIKAGAKNFVFANYMECGSSAVTVSGNRFTGIGLGPGADYLDAAGSIPGLGNRESAIEGGRTYGWTVRDNVVGLEADGTAAAGTTANGIKLDIALGGTLVRDNVVNNAAWSGIVVGGDGSKNTAGADADEAEITIVNNTVTNSRNDPYITSWWKSGGEGYVTAAWRFSAAGLEAAPIGMKQKAVDALLKTTMWRRPPGHARPYLGKGPGASRRVDSIIEYDSSGVRENTPAPGATGGEYNKVYGAAVVRWLRAGLEAGLELNRLTARTLEVENNELTGNVVGLVVCPASYCYADGTYGALAEDGLTPDEVIDTGLKVPTLTANRIYDNGKVTDMPGRFARADVVNALTGTHAGAGSNVLVLGGNYLGDSPEVRGAADTDGLAAEDDANVGPRETDPPVLAGAGGATFSGTTVTLTYAETLDGKSVPAAGAFTVTQTNGEGLSGKIEVGKVEVKGRSVVLTLAEAPGSGNSLTVSYDPNNAGGGKIRDAAGNAAAALASRMVAAAAAEPASSGDGGGCALASAGGGVDLGMLLPFMVVVIGRIFVRFDRLDVVSVSFPVSSLFLKLFKAPGDVGAPRRM